MAALRYLTELVFKEYFEYEKFYPLHWITHYNLDSNWQFHCFIQTTLIRSNFFSELGAFGSPNQNSTTITRGYLDGTHARLGLLRHRSCRWLRLLETLALRRFAHPCLSLISRRIQSNQGQMKIAIYFQIV
jgi:hypothetical protein